MGEVLFERSHNKVFKDVTPQGFAPVLQQALQQQKTSLNNYKVIEAWYRQNEYDPIFLMDHTANGDIQNLTSYLDRTAEHGLVPAMFHTDTIKALLSRLNDKKAIKSLNQAYRDMAKLELLVANSLITYANALQFGLIDPKRIYANYYTKTLRPDSASTSRIFSVENLKSYLDSIQPRNPQYLALQKALASGTLAPGMSKEETQRILVVNLERLRWKNKPTENRYVVVNIPDFTLNLMENGKCALCMKVCVGEGRNQDHANTLVEYDDSDKVDRPFTHETPQLNSLIYVAEVNPVWNIPQSIASKEIMVEAAKDRYYLSNKNIDVYKNGQKIEDTETIDWSQVKKDDDSYEFKQQPGADNALGKIKFLFNNKTNVYLHDTPTQAPFKQAMRAVSHGCVRLEKPLEFAHALFGDGERYQTILDNYGKDNPEPTRLYLPKKVPVYITYITCWVDETGTIQYRKDIYAQDIVLYAHLQKFTTV
ncbi:L,D-transpeptidase family protein [Mucilaginibacter sp. PPCGB 2223]|uniref:L,D-transpeptidase family protein n=1 Tax=Mucilaginibacter sp. PPCGB 2223 TaxID=1886027 RepID=UPI0020C7F4CA|nr:L,D-transpeptidase family protein [Mucilaginibacter sp. PPCGB 2223]